MYFRTFPIIFLIYDRVHSGNGKGQNLEGQGILYIKNKKILYNAKLFSIKNELCIPYRNK